MRSPQVTAILPAKDAASFIGTTLETLLRQFDDSAALKLVAIDDGSGDGTGDVMRAYAERFTHAEVLTNPRAQGLATARNQGLEHGRAPFVRLIARVIDTLKHRPVVVSGLPGMSIPAQRGALEGRRESDLLVLHSHREIRAFEALGDRIGMPVPTALATLPYARTASSADALTRSRAGAVGTAGAVDAVGAGDASRGASHDASRGAVAVAERERRGTDLVFAAQALVPAERHEREELVGILRRAAAARPNCDVQGRCCVNRS